MPSVLLLKKPKIPVFVIKKLYVLVLCYTYLVPWLLDRSDPSVAAVAINTTSNDLCLSSSSDTALTSDTIGRISNTCSCAIC